jgi:hypothetical protein
MKTFIRPQIINGIEYYYEIIPYYDPEKKTVRQKSKYLGKNQSCFPILAVLIMTS